MGNLDNKKPIDDRSSHRSVSGISRSSFFMSLALVGAIGFILGMRSDSPFLANIFNSSDGSLDFSSVQTTYDTLEKEYDGKIDKDKLIEGANRGLVDAAGDPYTVYMDKSEAEKFQKSLNGDIGGGIGAEIGIRSGQPTIVRVLPEHPAEKSGLENGDTILAVNDLSTKDMSLDKTVEKIRGEEGTTVKIIVMRDNQPKEFSVVRARVDNPSVQSSIENGIGVLKLSRFDENTGDLARRAALNFKNSGVKGVILDVRDNGGGYVVAAQDVAGIWLNNQTIITERRDNKVIDTIKSTGAPILADTPTTILINNGSASASEIIAGALKEYGKAKLVGEKTFGKGTVQKVLDLGDGRMMKVTIARWYTPNGKNITREGIAPDQNVELTTEHLDNGIDPQMDAARSSLESN